MSRLIDVDALLDGLEKLYRRRELNAAYNGDRGPFVTWNDAICAIKDAPTSQPKQMRGQWIPEPNCMYRCSSCGDHYPNIRGYMTFKYCPSCGAEMRGEQDDNS